MVDQGGQQEEEGTEFHKHLFGTQETSATLSFYPLAGPIFHTVIQIALSSNHILLIYIAYLISVVSNQCLKKILLHSN